MTTECPHGLPSLRCPDCRPGGPFVPPYEIAVPDQVQDGLLAGLLVRRGGTPPFARRRRGNRWAITINTTGGRVEGAIRGTAEDAADAVAALLEAFRAAAPPRPPVGPSGVSSSTEGPTR